MEAKLRQLMKHEGINSTRLAEILGIQASGISHIMSGRNKPSFDFIHKLLQRFPQINPDWLLLDKGPMYRDEIKNKGGQSSASGSGDRTPRPGGPFSSSAADPATPYNSGGIAGTGRESAGGTLSGGGLFGPDDNDIIPSAGNTGGTSGASGGYADGISGAASGGHAGSHAGSHIGGHAGDRAGNHADSYAGGHAGGQVSGHAGNNADNNTRLGGDHSPDFRRSASIARIVVFYKDKTFSEYQPE
jgi:hypothetical protein